MSQMTPSQARVIDPILTAVARGYESPESAVANVLFPTVPVNARGGTLMVFGKEDFDVVDSRRAPGANTKRVGFVYGSDTYNLRDHSLEAAVPIELMEEANAVPGIDLRSMGVRKVLNRMALERENIAATMARDANAYASTNKTTLSGTDLWTNSASNPFTVIEAGKEAIRKKIGRRPNFLVLGPTVLSAARVHDKVLSRLSTATDRNPATLMQLAALFEVDQVIEGAAIKNGANDTFEDVWGVDAILAYVAPKTMQEMGSQCYGYTYQLSNYPLVEEPYYDRNQKSWISPVTDARRPYLVGANGGYLIRNAVAPV